jgi:signal transduction histidine kinase
MQPDGSSEARDYRLETARKTLQVSRVLSAVMVPAFLYMIFQDRLIGMPYVLPWRLTALIPAAVFLLFCFRWLPAHPRWVVPAHATLLLGMMVNVTGLTFSVFRHRPDQSGVGYALMAGMVLVIFVVSIFAAGARRFVGAITVVPMVGMVAAFAVDGTLRKHEWSYLVNPAMAVVAVAFGGILQERIVRREFLARRLADQRREELETTVAEIARVNRQLTQEIEARTRLETQLERQAEALRQTNSRLETEVKGHQATAVKMEQYLAEVKRSNEELQQFANVVSHDLRAPLATISGFMEVLRGRLQEIGVTDAEAEESIQFSTKGVRRMDGMIEALLSYARLDSRARPSRMVDLNAVLEDVRLNMGSAIEFAHATIAAPSLPQVWADRNQMIQLFQNLLGNAIKYARPDAAPLVAVSSRAEGSWHCLSVKDNGIGFDPKYAQRVFDIFFRVDPHSGRDGVGIGLAICKKIVDRSGGRIWAESQPGEGSTFHFTLPSAPPTT